MAEQASGRGITIFKAGRVITMGREPAEAFAVLAGRVVGVGGDEGLRQQFPGARHVDFGDGVVIPGFNDAHMHLAHAADAMLQLDLSADAVGSLAEIKDKIRAQAEVTPAGTWIRGCRYDDGKMAEGRLLHRADLDAVAPEHPVLVTHVAGHWGVVNSRALELAGIGKDTRPPEGGEYGRDADGNPNGILYEQAFFDFAYPGVSRTGGSVAPEFSFEERVSGLGRAVAQFHAAGLTSVCDALVGPEDLRLFIEGGRRGVLTLRVNMLVAADHYGKMRSLGLVGELGGDRLRICGLKTFVDGAIGGRTCLLEQPFEGTSDDYGIQTRSTDELRDVVNEAHEQGTRVCVHANGDRAIKLILGLYEEAHKRRERPGLRHRIEHCTIVSEDVVKRMLRANVIAVPFGSYVDYHGGNLLKWYGEKRLKRMFAHRWFLDSGVGVAGSSDYPCGPFEPLRALQSCATRTGHDGAPVGVNQKISPAEALWLYTVGSAAACGEADWKGRLLPGFAADFVVLGGNPLTTDPGRIAAIPVRQTWVAGERVWADPEAASAA
ncbi:MAG TPA: amidohydrolase [Gammaproteobacteria bacterium]|nr:amidohydrolase [Gammaproteobacteria bacterium]